MTSRPKARIRRLRWRQSAVSLASAAAGYLVGISTAHAAPGPLRALRALSADTLGLHELARDVYVSGAALMGGLGRLSGWLGFADFGFAVHHADGATCASVQGIGFAILAISALITIALGRMRMVSEQRRLDLFRRLVEQGMTPPDGLVVAPARRDLRRGVVLLFAGLGLCVAGFILGDRGLGAGGLIPAFIGVGYLVSYRLALGEGVSHPRGSPDS